MKNILLILLLILLIVLLFSKKEYFANYTYCNWFDYDISTSKCPSGSKCSNIGICRVQEDCDNFPDIKCK